LNDIGPLAEAVAFRRPIAALPPGFDWHYAFGQTFEYLQAKDSVEHPLQFAIETDYDTGGRRVRETHVVDVGALLYGPAIRDDASRFYYDFPRKFDPRAGEMMKAMEGLIHAVNTLHGENIDTA
jgi:hypothetical protein